MIKVPVDLVSPEASPWLPYGCLLFVVFTPILCPCISMVSQCVQISSSYEITSQI